MSSEGHEMYTVTCETCKKEAQVSFKTDGKTPLYCMECFEKSTGIDPHNVIIF